MLAALPLVVLFGDNSLAAERAPVSEEGLLEEVPIVLSATRLAQRTDETPVAVTLIDREMIEASGAVELIDLLRLVPGFQVAHTTGNLFTVSAHGTGTPWFSRIQVLIDGRSVYHTAFSGLDWTQLGIALPDIERIEVVRGPNIASYGVNAIQGSVNIVTRHPVQDRGWFFQATAGDIDRGDAIARYAGSAGDLDYRLTYQHRENSGFDERLDGTRLDALTFRGIYTPSARDELDLQFDIGNSALGDDLIPGYFPSDEREVTSASAFARWTRARDADNSWYLQLSADHYDSDEDARKLVSEWFDVAPAVVPFLVGEPDQRFSYNQFETRTNRIDVEFQHFLRPHADLRFAWGLGYRWDEIDHFLSPDDEVLDASSRRAFGSLEWRPGSSWVVNLGGLLDDNSLGGTSFSPRLGINYRLSPRDTLRMAASRAHKHPSLLEEHWYAEMALDDGAPFTVWITSAGDLDTETRDVFELGYVGERLNGKLRWDARGYLDRVDGAVIYARDESCPQPATGPGFPFCYVIDNHMSYDAAGIEFEIAYRPRPRDLFRLHYAYAEIDGEVPYYTVPDIPKDLERTAPRHSGGLLASRKLRGGWELSGAVYYVDATDWYIDGGLVDEYVRTDLRISKELRSGRTEARLEFLLQNLGSGYDEFSELNHYDTRAFVRLSLGLR
jgi:iron complex outermembrane receptor protein